MNIRIALYPFALFVTLFATSNTGAQEFTKSGYLEKRVEIIRRLGDNRSNSRVMKMKTNFREKDLLAIGNERNYHLLQLIPYKAVDSLTFSVITFEYLPLEILEKTPLAEYEVFDYGPPPPKWLSMVVGTVAGDLFKGADAEFGNSLEKNAKDIADGHAQSVFTSVKTGNWMEISYTHKDQKHRPIFQIDPDEEEKFLALLKSKTEKTIRKFINGSEIFPNEIPFPNSWYEINEDSKILILIVFSETELAIIGNDARWHKEKRIPYSNISQFDTGKTVNFGITGFKNMPTHLGSLKLRYTESDSLRNINLLIDDAKAAYNILSDKVKK